MRCGHSWCEAHDIGWDDPLHVKWYDPARCGKHVRVASLEECLQTHRALGISKQCEYMTVFGEQCGAEAMSTSGGWWHRAPHIFEKAEQ